ncbi:hypothetical protein KP509_1Z169300 [Ceratopteris richardii]|nr:hypothetical protein KP509_1Z169300 [Ceratopteris richardii]
MGGWTRLFLCMGGGLWSNRPNVGKFLNGGLYHSLLLAILAVSVSAQTNSSLPEACMHLTNSNFSQDCQEALYGKVQLIVDDYTQKLSDQFDFCVRNTKEERDAAFDFSKDLTFLTTCLFDTAGTMLDRLCSAAEIKAYIDSLVNLIGSGTSGLATPLISNVNCNDNKWSQGCEAGWSASLNVPTANTSDLYSNVSTIPLRDESTFLYCCAGFFCPRGLSCMIQAKIGL